MADVQFGLILRAQFPREDDMQVRFGELLDQVRLADRLGYHSLTTGMHYSSAPLQLLQQLPFLARAMAGAIDGLGITRAAILFPYDDYGIDVADTLRRELGERDINDVDLVRYSIDSVVSDVVDGALLDAPQAVGMIGSLPSGAQVLGELRSRVQGRQLPTVVSDGLRSPEVATIIDPIDRTAIDGVQGVSLERMDSRID